MRIVLFFAGIATAVGVWTFAVLSAPQTANVAGSQTAVSVHKSIRQSAVQSLQIPAQARARNRSSVVSRRRMPRPSSVQGPTINPLAVIVNGQVMPPIPVGNNASLMRAAGMWHNLSIFVPATQQTELFILGIPNIPASVSAPLLVGMRQNNVSHQDIIVHTTFWEECLARGWYLLAPLSSGPPGFLTTGGATIHAQVNTEAALEWVTANYPIESSRIYGVGFSAGASVLGTYAARHLDPQDPMFAAIVYHTGGSDLVDTYNSLDSTDQAVLANLMGGTPTAIPFEYRRVGSVELDLVPTWVAGGDHMAWNLGSIPTQVWYATNDMNGLLVTQTSELFDWMNLNGNGPVSLYMGVNPDPTNGAHNWSLLNETQICDWFAMQVLTPPQSGDLLIDQDARYHYFDVQQSVPGAFSRLGFVITLGNNELELKQTDNVDRITLSPADLGLFTVSGVVLTLDLEALDSGDEVVLEGLALAPLNVVRDGMASANWVYSATEETLTISEPQTGWHVWSVQF
ncbi:MAG: hypothetical protein ACI9X4_002521 [Glaciecola sp.]|jgi:hypothetical protein